MSPHLKLSTIALLCLAGSQTGWAQEPGFTETAEQDEGIVWTAQAQAGLLMATGNSSTTTLAGGLQTSRKQGVNQVLINLAGAFARSTINLASDADNDGFISEAEFDRITRTTSQSWLIKPRYDRFLDKKNALYLAALLASDKPAGKTIVGSGQVGYSRHLLTSKVHDLTLESGYDFSYEDLEAGGSPSLRIHSLRLSGGYQGKLSADTSLSYALEGLFNLNELSTASGPVDRLQDTRIETRLALTTNLYRNLSFSFSFLARYDSVPAPRPKQSLPFADGFRPLADRLDTRTEAALVIHFL